MFAYEKYKAMSEKKGPSRLTHGLTTFIGICELAGAFGVVLPMATGIAPWLSAWAAIGLATVMLLAIGYHGILPLLQPFVTDGVIEENAHQIAYFGFCRGRHRAAISTSVDEARAPRQWCGRLECSDIPRQA